MSLILVLFRVAQTRCRNRPGKGKLLESGSSSFSIKVTSLPPRPRTLVTINHKDTSLNVGSHNVAIDIKVDANELALRKDG